MYRDDAALIIAILTEWLAGLSVHICAPYVWDLWQPEQGVFCSNSTPMERAVL